MDFSRQEYWSGLPCPPPGDLPNPTIKPGTSCILLAGGFFTTSATWGALTIPSGINYLISYFIPLFCLSLLQSLCFAVCPCQLTFEEPFALLQELQMNTAMFNILEHSRAREEDIHHMKYHPACYYLTSLTQMLSNEGNAVEFPLPHLKKRKLSIFNDKIHFLPIPKANC